jgi:hypothetical protein
LKPQGEAHGSVPSANGDASTSILLPNQGRKKGGPLLDRLRLEIKALYPRGVPELADLSNPSLCSDVRRSLGDTKRPVSDSSILRAAGRRKA